MKRKNLIALGASIALVLVLVLTGCGQATTTGGGGGAAPAGAATDKVYKVVNPAGEFIPVQTQGLSPRLTTIDGKTIYVCQGEADPVIMPALIKILKKDYPKTTWLYYDRADFGPNVPGTGGGSTTTGQVEDPDILKKVQAVIRGIGW